MASEHDRVIKALQYRTRGAGAVGSRLALYLRSGAATPQLDALRSRNIPQCPNCLVVFDTWDELREHTRDMKGECQPGLVGHIDGGQ